MKKNCIEKVRDWADDKLLLVELYEKNGGWHQVIRVENADIVNAEVINELKIK